MGGIGNPAGRGTVRTWARWVFWGLIVCVAVAMIAVSAAEAGDRRTRVVTFKASGAVTASTSQTTGFDVSAYIEGQVLISVTAESDPSTITYTVQTSDDNSTYYDHTSGGTISATGQYRLAVTNFGKYVRVAYTVGGTSMTFSIVGVFKN